MIRTVAAQFHAKDRGSAWRRTVTLTMGAANLSSASAAPYLSCYPVADLATASDGIFIMSYVQHKPLASRFIGQQMTLRRLPFCSLQGMWHHHQICAGPNSPLAALNDSLQSFLNLGAPREKLIVSTPIISEFGCVPECVPCPAISEG